MGGAAVVVNRDALDIVGMVGMNVLFGVLSAGAAHPTPTTAETISPDPRQSRPNEMLQRGIFSRGLKS